MKRTIAAVALVLALTACSGGADTPSPDEQTEGQHPVTDAAELEGQWTSPSGNILSFSADQGRYTYQTFSGRTGQGPYDAAADVPTIDFDGFLYDFILRDDGVLLPNQNGSGGDAESIDHFTFRRSSDARIDLWELSDLSGVWQNAGHRRRPHGVSELHQTIHGQRHHRGRPGRQGTVSGHERTHLPVPRPG